jgi:hypothetical protein
LQFHTLLQLCYCSSRSLSYTPFFCLIFTLVTMPSFLRAFVLLGGVLAVGSRAGPVVMRDVEVYPLAARSRADPMMVRGIDSLPFLEERGFKSHVLGNHSLVTSHVNDVLFNL